MNDTPWAMIRYEYDALNNPVYEGRHKSPGVGDSDKGWYLYKYSWDSTGNMILKQGPKIGAWDNRTSFF